jgi:hypothetical protein
MSATTATCVKHLWERYLEVHNRLERVVRVCVHCGCKEICWARPSFHRRVDAASAETMLAVPSGACSSSQER